MSEPQKMSLGTLGLLIYFSLCIIAAVGYLWKKFPPVLREDVSFEASAPKQSEDRPGKSKLGLPTEPAKSGTAPTQTTESISTLSVAPTRPTAAQPNAGSPNPPKEQKPSTDSEKPGKAPDKTKEETSRTAKEGNAARYLLSNFIAVLIALGFLGGSTSGITSLVSYIGNDDLHVNWYSWYWVRPWTGAAMGVVAVLSLDFLNFDPKSRAAICFLSFLAGFLTRQFIDKLVDIGESIFQSKRNDVREDKLKKKDDDGSSNQLGKGTSAKKPAVPGGVASNDSGA